MSTHDLDIEPSPGDGSRFTRKPPNPGYRVSAVPKRYADQVQLSAVLRAVYGPLRTEADIIDATAWLLHHWRRRASGLAEAGWGPLGLGTRRSRLSNALACPVTFVLTYNKRKKGRKSCGLTTLCPFCWAREVRRYWLRIDAAFFPHVNVKKQPRVRPVDTGPSEEESAPFTRSVKDVETGAKSPYDLVRREFAFQIPMVYRARVYGHYVPVCGMMAWLDSRLRGEPDPQFHRLHECRALLKSAGPGGAMLEVIQFRRVGDDRSPYPWEVYVRQLILAVDGMNVPRKIHEMSTAQSRMHVVIPRPGRNVVTAEVARALRYPKFLVEPRTPVAEVAEYLRIRGRHRLVASYGKFRRKNDAT